MTATFDILIRAAAPEEAQSLSELALRSKGHWGYDEEFLDACREELSVNAHYVASHPVYVLEEGSSVIGFYSLEETDEGIELELLFVEPEAVGKGYGRRLWQHAVETARRLGHPLMVIESDPFAEPFYLSMGAVRVGETTSGARVEGRMLPLLHFSLKEQ